MRERVLGMTFRSGVRLVFALAIAGSIVVLTNNAADAASRLEKAVTKLTEKAYGRDLENLSDDEIEEVAENITDKADDIEYDDDSNFREHILDTWGRGASTSRRHIEKCPYCIDVANDVRSGQPDLTPVRNRIPTCFMIAGVYYGADPGGLLYRLHPQTGQAMGPAEGYIWFGGGRYVGVRF